jgi:hypothetical protein
MAQGIPCIGFGTRKECLRPVSRCDTDQELIWVTLRLAKLVHSALRFAAAPYPALFRKWGSGHGTQHLPILRMLWCRVLSSWVVHVYAYKVYLELLFHHRELIVHSENIRAVMTWDTILTYFDA